MEDKNYTDKEELVFYETSINQVYFMNGTNEKNQEGSERKLENSIFFKTVFVDNKNSTQLENFLALTT